MVQATIPKDLDIYMDGNDPSESGDIKVVCSPLLIMDNCDEITQWSIHSGYGTRSLDKTIVKEGTGSIKLTIFPLNTVILKCVKSSGSWDISSHKYLKIWLRRGDISLFDLALYFGESTYDEQAKTTQVNAGLNEWRENSWDISAIPPENRDAVTIFAIRAKNLDLEKSAYLWVDFLRADPGPSEIKAFDGDRIITIYPKIYAGFYIGNGVDDRQINIPRKGTPCAVLIQRAAGSLNNAAVWRHKNNESGKSFKIDGGALLTDGIKTFGNCFFTIGTNERVNNPYDIFCYLAFFED
ncbi:MAG: hypothetical protein ACPL6D_04545 [Thermodesulfobacteriota bacterium]